MPIFFAQCKSFSHFLTENIGVQWKFNGSNTFGTMKISSRQGLFEPMRVDNSARPGGIIGVSFRLSSI